LILSIEKALLQKNEAEPASRPNPCPFGTFGIPPADSASRAGGMPKASEDRSLGTLANNMHLRRKVLILPFVAFLHASAEPGPTPSATIHSYTGGWSKATAAANSLSQSRLDKLSPSELNKYAELDSPVTVIVLSVGRLVQGLEDIKERIVDVRITNPNPYSIFFQGRQYRENKTIKPKLNKLKDGKWTLAGRDLCGRGVRDWVIEPNASIDVMLSLDPELKEQQLVGTFYRVDKPSIQSDCLLYEKK